MYKLYFCIFPIVVNLKTFFFSSILPTMMHKAFTILLGKMHAEHDILSACSQVGICFPTHGIGIFLH